jgi:NAD(P)-dependent dehydrogenase (short-subunit alcohol dehydrogenase family)
MDAPWTASISTGRWALVTGASPGLGARFAQVLDAAGASVVVTARRAHRLAVVAERLAHPSLAIAAAGTSRFVGQATAPAASGPSAHTALFTGASSTRPSRT